MPKPHPLRLAIKALIVFALANLAFAYFNPAMGRLSIFNHLGRGRLRFPAQTQPTDKFNQGVLLFQDIDAMFASHAISAGPKPIGEYRVILLGKSSIWGYALQSHDILSEQINNMNLVACGKKR